MPSPNSTANALDATDHADKTITANCAQAAPPRAPRRRALLYETSDSRCDRVLAHDPCPPAARALQVRRGLRVRVREYRILYTVPDDVLLVVVVRLGHRRDISEQ